MKQENTAIGLLNQRDTKIINLKVPTDSWKFLKVQAINNNCSMTDVVNYLISNYMEKERKKNIN